MNKLCPFCSEEIKATAIKCKHCGEWFDERPSGEGSPSGSQDGFSSGRYPGSSSGSQPPTPSANTLLTGIHLVRHALDDRYEVIEEIGSGGMATVYKATQKSLGRTVALKVIHQNLVHDQEFVKRFHREAQISASLQHPNIVTIYDVGEAQGVHYMAMEYLEGTDLRRLISSRGPLSQEETLRYILPLADALDYAHGENLVHRDVKSANIYITSRGRVVLMDFGIVHAAAGTKLTRAGTIIGSPEYMSPEQASGQQVDYRTDLYSLGVVMYECLSGKVPFSSDSTAGLIYQVVQERPDLSLMTGVDEKVKHLVSALLEKKADQRLASAKRVMATIDEFLHERSGLPKYREESIDTGEHQDDINREGIETSSSIFQRSAVAETSLIDPEAATPSDSFKDPFHGLLVYVKGGTFNMGNTWGGSWAFLSDEKPAHQVTLSNYYIGKYPVTQKQWQQVMGTNPSNFSGCDNCPVESVSWNDVQEFIRKLNQQTGKRYRLPTEAEWEFAARGGKKSLGFQYSGSNTLGDVAWFWGNSNRKPTTVGRKRANELGIHDMSGNVWEWCNDWFGIYSSSSKTNPAGPSLGSGRVLRGGSWGDSARYCRVSGRDRNTPDYRYSRVGFRLSRMP